MMCFTYMDLIPSLRHLRLSINAIFMYNVRLPEINDNSRFVDTFVNDYEELKDSHGQT